MRRTRERVGRDAGVGFAAEHANAGRVEIGCEWLKLGEAFGLDLDLGRWAWDGGVGKGERRAAGALDGVLGRRRRCAK